MSISGISGAQSVLAASQSQQIARPSSSTAEQAPGFSDRMGDALRQVAREQETANQMREDFELGRTDNLASVMVQQQVASLGFEMTLQVRNKALGAYRDIMNMPV
jgi:flagellar hook-basal body complex protein FliE